MNSEKNKVFELIEAAQNGVQEAFVELKTLYRPLLESQITKHKAPDMAMQDVEDMRQEALITFCNSVCSYRREPDGVEFGLYAKICIENGLASFMRSYNRRQNRATMPLSFAVERVGSVIDPLQALVDKENAADLVREIKNNLSDYENRVWWLYISGLSVSEIASQLGVSDAKSVSNAIYRIRKKLRSLISERD